MSLTQALKGALGLLASFWKATGENQRLLSFFLIAYRNNFLQLEEEKEKHKIL